ncbi:MAG: nuclear transport factor 2 family protein [Longimicrobiales bacterium]
MPRSIPGTVLTGLLLASGLPTPVAGQADADPVLLDLNRRLFETQILDQDPTFLQSISDDTYVVVAPGGVIESREQAIRGLRAFETVDSITISNERVVRQGSTAIVLNRLVIHGAIQGPVGQVGPTSAMTVFHRTEDGRWVAVSRALTRCDPRAVERGIC